MSAKVRPLLCAALEATFRASATKVLRDGTLRFEGEGYRVTIRPSLHPGEFPRVEFSASAHLDHVARALVRLAGSASRPTEDLSLHVRHQQLFGVWGPRHGAALSRRGPAVLEVQGDDYPGLFAQHLRAIVEGEVLPLVRRCAAPEVYDGLLNDDPEAEQPFLDRCQRARRGVAVRWNLGGAGLEALVARYDATLAGWHPAARGDYDAARQAALAAPSNGAL